MFRLATTLAISSAFAVPAVAGPNSPCAGDVATPIVAAVAVIEAPQVDALPAEFMDRISAAVAGKAGDNESLW